MVKTALFFVENQKFTMILSLAALLFGVFGLIRLNSETFPNVNVGTVVITTYYDGATASDIETKITKPLEEEIRSVSGLKKVKSTSQPGMSRIVTIVDIDKYDVEKVVSDLQRAVDRASTLPSDLRSPPHFIEVKSEEFPVIEVAVVGPNKDRLRNRAADLLKEEIEDNPKVSSVQVSGYRERQFNIYMDLEKMEKHHVALNEVMSTITSRNVTIPGGRIERGQEQKLLRIEGKARTVGDLENLIVRSNFSGQAVRLKDVARIADSEEDARTLARYEGQEATLLTISKKGGVDLISLAAEVRKATEEFKSKYHGELDFIIFNNEGKRVGNRIAVLSSNGLIGLGLVLLFLLIFLPGWIGVVTSLSLPLAIMGTIGLIPVFDMSLNTISILALVIAIGMLVDNAVVISENFVRLREAGETPREAVRKSVSSLWIPISATAMTTIAAFLPMLVTTGVIGQFIVGIPILVTVALLLSLLESFYLLPSRLELVARKVRQAKSEKHKADWFSRRILPAFENFMRKMVSHRYWVLGGFTSLLILSIFLIAVVNRVDLFPSEQTEIYIARVEMPEGTRIETTDQLMGDLLVSIRQELKGELAHVVARSGRSETDPMDPKRREGSNVALAMLFVTEETKNNAETAAILERLRKIKLSGAKSLTFEAAAQGPPIGDPVNATFRSNNINSLDQVTKRVRKKLEATPGIFDVKIDDVYGEDEIMVKADHEKISRLGLSLQQVGQTIRTAIAGLELSDVNLNNREVAYFLRLEDDDRRSIETLKDVRIADPRGNLIPLGTLAEFETKQGERLIHRYDFRRSKTLTANIDTTKIAAVKANAILEKEFKTLQNEFKDVSLTFGGEGENTKESMQSLLQALILSLIGIFALLVLIFRSYLRPFIILTTIPLGLVGVSVAFFLHGKPISFLAMIGVIGLGGIIVNSGIVLISFIEELKQNNQGSIHEILVKAAGLRLRAVTVTSLTTVSGLLPTAYGLGGADEFIIPMTMALAWGLVSGTMLTLIWVPCAYAILEDITRFFTSRKKEELTVPTLNDSNSPHQSRQQEAAI